MNPRTRPITTSASATPIMGPAVPPPANPKLEVDHDDPLFGQLPHRVGRTLARVAGILHTAVGHLIGAERRRLVDRHAAELEPPREVERRSHAPREDPGLEAVAGRVRELDRLVERLDGVDGANGAEDLLARDLQ